MSGETTTVITHYTPDLPAWLVIGFGVMLAGLLTSTVVMIIDSLRARRQRKADKVMSRLAKVIDEYDEAQDALDATYRSGMYRMQRLGRENIYE